MLCRVSLFCAFVAFLPSVASTATVGTSAGSNSTYLSADGFDAMVIDNQSGFVEYISPAMHDAPIDAAPVFRVRPRAEPLGWVVTDCSVKGISCAEIHSHTGNTLIAFKPAIAGDTYSIRGVKFEILSVGTFAGSRATQRRVYWVKFTAPTPLKSGDFMYVDGVGVVRYMSADEAVFREPGGAAFLRARFLADGPGLLSPDGFPNAVR